MPPARTCSASFFAIATLFALGGCSAAGASKEGGGLGYDSGSSVDQDGSTGGGDDTGFVLGDSNVAQDTLLSPDGACAATSFAGVRVPPSMLLIFDQSLSMENCADGSYGSCPGADKWSAATSAVHDLISSVPQDLNVGIKFFGTLDDSCNDADYAKPDVAVGPLSTTQKPIDCWLGKQSCAGITAATPYTLTEMGPALRGGIGYLKGIKADGQRIAILITDGDPVNCDTGNDITDVIAAASAGFNATPKVLTYVIGVPGSTIANLSQVASAGGGKRTPTCIANTTNAASACHYQIGTGNVQADLLAALNDITGKSLSCTFKVPAPTGDAGVDPNNVNVDLTEGGTMTTLNKDTSHANGWDYTDGGTTITLYGPPCDSVLHDGTAKVDILLGCPTIQPQ